MSTMYPVLSPETQGLSVSSVCGSLQNHRFCLSFVCLVGSSGSTGWPETYDVAKGDLELLIPLPPPGIAVSAQSMQCWDGTRALCMLGKRSTS